MMITKDGTKCLLVFDKKTLYVIDSKTFAIESQIELPEDLVDFELLENGDLHLILENPKFDDANYQFQKKIKKKLNEKYKEIEAKRRQYKDSKIPKSDQLDESNVTSQSRRSNAYLTTEGDPGIDDEGNFILDDSGREIRKPNIGGKFNYLNLSSKNNLPGNEVEFLDDSQVKKSGSKSKLTSRSNLFDESEIPLTSQMSLFRRHKDDLQMEEIDPKKFKYTIQKLVVSEYNPDQPEDSLYTIYQGKHRILSMKTSTQDLIEGNVSSGLLNSSRRSFYSGNTSSKYVEEEMLQNSKTMYELLVFSDNQVAEFVKYWTGLSSAPKTEKIVIEEMLNLEELSAEDVLLQNCYFSEFRDFWHQRSERVDDPEMLKIGSNFKFHGIYNDAKVGWSFLSYSDMVESRKYINIIAKKKSHKKAYKIKINMSRNRGFQISQTFQLKLADASKFKYDDFAFYLDSSSTLITFRFSLRTKKLCYFKVLSKESSSPHPVCYSRKKRLFFIPIKNKIHVYDNRLKFHLDSLEMNKNVEQIIVNDERDLLMIYDLYFYYEVDMNRLIMRRQMAATNRTKDQFFYPMNMRDLPTGTPWKGVFYYLGSKTIRPIATSEGLELKSFPFRVLNRCFDRKVHARAVRQYASYYYSKLDESGRIDYDYGPLNPLFMAIFNQNSGLLEELLNEHYYPSRVFHYVSPLEYAFICKNKASIRETCQALLKRDEEVHFSRSDFKYLLASDQKICHKVISTMISDPDIDGMPNLIYMQEPVDLRFNDEMLSMAVKLKRADDELEVQAEKKQTHRKRKKSTNIDKYYIGNQSGISKSEISVTTVPFKYNYRLGTEDSAMLIDRFSQTASDEFILSDWKEIINLKWKRIKFAYLVLFLIFYVFLVFITLSLSFLKESQLCRWFSMGLDTLFLIYEIFRFLTFAAYKPVL